MSKSNIMVVEDSGIVLLDIQKSLNSLGYTVVATASSKDEAIRKADETRPDLVLMDIRLGEEMGGIDAADHIRENFNIPIVFLTGYADEDTFQRAKIADPFGYILKPFDPKGLRTTIEIALHNHELKSRLRESEERYRTLIETMNDGVGQIDADGKIIFANDTLCQMFGMTLEELIGCEHTDLFVEESQELQRKEFETRKAGISNSFETALKRKDGTTIPVILSGSPVFDQYGGFAGSIGVFTDISERKQTERALQVSEEKYRVLFSEMSAACALHEIVCDEDGNAIDYITLEVNAAYETILGVKAENVIGRRASEVLPKEELEHWLSIFGPVALSGKSSIYEVFSPLTDKHFEGSAYSPEPGKFAVTFLDHTERRRAEEEIRKSKQALEEAEQIVHLGHYEIDTISGEAIWSEEIFNIFGLEPNSSAPTLETYSELIHPDDRLKVYELYEESVQQGVPFDLVYRIVRPNGDVRYVHSNARTREDENGKTTKLFGTFQDVTELKQVEIALQESEVRYRTLFENSPIAIWEEDFSEVQEHFNDLQEKGVADFRDYFEQHPDEISRLTDFVKITSVNETSVSFFDASSKDEFSQRLSHYSIENLLEVFREEFIALAEGQTKFNSEIVIQDLVGRKRTLFLDLAVAPAYERKLDRVLVSFIDITERKQAEDIMLARYRLVRKSLTESLPVLLQATLDEIEALTDSTVSFFHFVEEDEINLSLQAWSTNTIEKLCNVEGEGLHYPIDKAGVWVDCVRERKPIIHNEYASLEHRKGLPEGHAEIKRELVVPVIRGERLVAIIGVGNKEAEYTHKDVEVVSLLADLAWDIVERKQTEAALRESEALYHDLVETAQDLIWQCDEKGRYVYLNPAWEDVFGYKVEEMLEKPFSDFQSPEYAQRDVAVYESILEGEAVKNFETVHIGKDGRQIHLVFNAKAIRDEQGNVIGSRGTAYDITERKRAEDALVKSENLLQESQKIAHMGHYALDIPNGTWESSEGLNELFGIDWDYQTNVEGWLQLIHPDDRENMAAYLAEDVVKKHQGFDREYRIVRAKDGETCWVHGLGRLEFDESGNPVRMIGNIQDITDRKWAEEKIQESERRYRSIVESSPLGMHMYELQDQDKLIFIGSNPAADAILRVDNSIFIGKTIEDAFPPLVQTEAPERYKRAAAEGILWKTEQIDYDADGIVGAFEVIAFQTTPNKMVATFQDITARKQAVDALRKSEERYRAVVENQTEFIVRWKPDGTRTFVNEAYLRYYNITMEEALTSSFMSLIVEEDRPAVEEKNARLISGKSQTETDVHRVIRSDGSLGWQEWADHALHDENGNVIEFQSIGRDITEQKRAELARQESERRFREVLENVQLIAISTDVEGKITFCNDYLLGLVGWTRDELIGKNWFETCLPPDVGPTVWATFAESLAQENVPSYYENEIQTKAGERRWVVWNNTMLRDIQGRVIGTSSIGEDITERKRAELALKAKTGELEALFSISSHLRTAQSADEMLPVILTEMRRVLRSDANAIVLLNVDGKHFTYAHSDGSLVVNKGNQFDVENSISGWVLQTRQPYTTDDFASDPKKTTNLQGDDNLGPAIFAPVISESEFLGVLICAREKGSGSQPYLTSEVQLLTAIGEMVGNALRRAMLYDQAMTRLQHVQTLHSIDMAISANLDLSVILDVLLTQGIAQMDVDAACILLLNPHTHMLEFSAGNGFRTKEIKSARLRLGEGLPGQAAMDRKVLHLPRLSDAEDLVRRYLLDEGFVSYQAAPLIAKGQLQGVLEIYNRKPMVENEEQSGFLETLATQAAIAIDNSQLFSDLQRSNFDLEMAYDATIEGWSRALELRDQETEGHTLRVTDMTVRLAQAMGVRSGELIHVRRGALLHDIGKMGVPDRILLKPGKLDPDEWKVMKQHTVYAFEMLWPIEFLRLAIDIPHCHHERWDGTGYPRQLEGEQIPLSARVFAVADVWDALTSDRPYRKAWSDEKALEYITSNVGKHFDPRVVEQFLVFLKSNGQNHE